MASIRERFRSLRHAWNAFQNEDDRVLRADPGVSYGGGFSSYNPQRQRFSLANERSTLASIYTRLAIDVAAIDIRHVRLDENGRFESVISSGLNNCLTLEANVDQGSRALKQDAAMTLFEKGTIAIVPIDTDLNPLDTGGFDIQTMRVGEIVAWYPRHVRVNVYDDRPVINGGKRREIVLPKSKVAIVENPLYSVMNEPNSTLQRLRQKLGLLDTVDSRASAGKLDLIIQLPYVVKSEARKEQAQQRAKDIEMQLTDSAYGIAYTDGTEKITQLNRPAENSLAAQVESLTAKLYAELGLTKEVFDGTADEATMLNYYNRTIEPLVAAITEAMKRVFLTKTARSQGQSIEYYRDPFKLVPINQIAEIADKFTRNEILTSNEVRGILGFKPHTDPKADQLVNSNMPQSDTHAAPDQLSTQKPPPEGKDGELQNGT